MGLQGAANSVGLVVAVLLGSLCVSTCQGAFNVTQVLQPFPNFSTLNDWLTKTGVANEINNRSSLTILAPSNEVLSSYLSGVPNAYTDPSTVADTLRYNVLLTYYGLTQLAQLTANGTSVTTLLQTTGLANGTQGFVTLYNNGTSYLLGHEVADKFGNETILGNVTQDQYLYSVLQVSAILQPVPFTVPAPTPAPSPAPSSPPAPAPAAPGVPVPGTGPAANSTASPNPSDASARGGWNGLLLAMLLASVVTLM